MFLILCLKTRYTIFKYKKYSKQKYLLTVNTLDVPSMFYCYCDVIGVIGLTTW